MVTRSLKSQIRRDARRVFLDLDEFAVLETIRYWDRGQSVPPLELRIPIVVDEDANMNSVWNKNKNQQRIGNDKAMFQVEKVFFCAMEDFSPPPKKGRMMQVGDHTYEVLGNSLQGGLVKVELRELEE